MEVRIGVQDSAREITFESKSDQEQIADAVAKALADGAVLALPDDKGRQFICIRLTRWPFRRARRVQPPPSGLRRRVTARRTQAARPSVPFFRCGARSGVKSWAHTLEVQAVLSTDEQ